MSYSLRLCLPLVLVLSLLGACRTVPDKANANFAAPGEAVYHFVAVWMNAPEDTAQRTAISEATRSFAEIPGVLFAEAGLAMPDERPVVVSDYDVGILIIFENEAALRAYQTHPLHQAAVRDVLRPMAEQIRVYDFQTQSEF